MSDLGWRPWLFYPKNLLKKKPIGGFKLPPHCITAPKSSGWKAWFIISHGSVGAAHPARQCCSTRTVLDVCGGIAGRPPWLEHPKVVICLPELLSSCLCRTIAIFVLLSAWQLASKKELCKKGKPQFASTNQTHVANISIGQAKSWPNLSPVRQDIQATDTGRRGSLEPPNAAVYTEVSEETGVGRGTGWPGWAMFLLVKDHNLLFRSRCRGIWEWYRETNWSLIGACPTGEMPALWDSKLPIMGGVQRESGRDV